jgi:hypothetical protein
MSHKLRPQQLPDLLQAAARNPVSRVGHPQLVSWCIARDRASSTLELEAERQLIVPDARTRSAPPFRPTKAHPRGPR